MPEKFPFQRNCPREAMLAQDFDDLSQRHLALAGQNIRVWVSCRGFGNAVLDVNVTNPLGKLRPRFARGFAAEPPSVMRVPDEADRFPQPGEQLAARAGRGERVVCFEQQFNAPAAFPSFLLPPPDRLSRLIVVRFGQRLSPRAAAKNADVLRVPRFGPLAKHQELSPGFFIIADEFKGRVCDSELDVMLRQQRVRPVRWPASVHGPLRQISAPIDGTHFKSSKSKLAEKIADLRKSQLRTAES